MKKYLFILLLFLSFSLIAQVKIIRVADATTAIGENISEGTQVYNRATGKVWIANTAVISTATLTTASGSFDTLDTILNIATTSEINTGSIDNKAMSPLGFANSNYASDISTNNSKVGVTDEISNVIEDLTPDLGGDLNLNDFDITGDGTVNINGGATFRGSMNLSVNTTPTVAPEMSFKGYRHHWRYGIDVANHGGSVDYVMLAEDVNGTGGVRDLIYVSRHKEGDNSITDDSGFPTIGFWITPPSDHTQTTFNTHDSKPNRTTVGIRKSAFTTSNKMLAFFGSEDAVADLWVDNEYTAGPFWKVKGDITIKSSDINNTPFLKLNANPSDGSSDFKIHNFYSGGTGYELRKYSGTTLFSTYNANNDRTTLTGDIFAADSNFSRDGVAAIELLAGDAFGGIIGTDTPHNLTLRTNNTERLIINNTTGNISIGNNATPTNKLEAQGNIKAFGDLLASGKVDVVGNAEAAAFVKDGGDGTNVLLDDGTTAPLSGLQPVIISNSTLKANSYAKRVLNNGGTFESIDQLFFDLNTVTTESLQFTPNAVQADTLYGIDASDYLTGTGGDFVFSQTNTAYKENVNGVLELVAANTPRIDYRLNASGELLLEPSITNILLRSEEIDNASWSKYRTTVTSDIIEAPNGTFTADFLKETAETNSHVLRQNFTATNNVNYVFSAFFKKAGNNYIRMRVLNKSGTALGAYFDLTQGTEFSKDVGVTTYIENYGNGWYRCAISLNILSGGYTPYVDIRTSQTGSDDSFLGNTSNGVYVWGAQIEQSNYLTTYIPTTSTSETRGLASVSGAGSTSTINSEEGVLYLEAAALFDDTTTQRLISLSDGTTSNQIILGYDAFSNRIKASLFDGGLENVKLSYVVTDITELHKIAFKWAETDFALWVDGTEVATNTSSSVDAADTYNELQLADGVGSNNFIGRIRELKVFPVALTDTELTALTSKVDYTPKHLARTDVDPYFTKDVTIQGVINSAPKIITQAGATDTLAFEDSGYIINYTSGSTKTVTIPTNSNDAIPVGATIVLINSGAGDLTFVTTGITLNDDLTNQTIVQYAKRTLIKTDTDTWLLSY